MPYVEAVWKDYGILYASSPPKFPAVAWLQTTYRIITRRTWVLVSQVLPLCKCAAFSAARDYISKSGANLPASICNSQKGGDSTANSATICYPMSRTATCAKLRERIEPQSTACTSCNINPTSMSTISACCSIRSSKACRLHCVHQNRRIRTNERAFCHSILAHEMLLPFPIALPLTQTTCSVNAS